jgi:hypothetical protein
VIAGSSRDSPQAANPKAWTLEKVPGFWLSRKPALTKMLILGAGKPIMILSIQSLCFSWLFAVLLCSLNQF